MSSSELYPFDGSCELSRDADLTLLFENGSELKADSHSLCLASPILKIPITDCAKSDVLQVGQDDLQAWIRLLNVIHPSGPVFQPCHTIFPSFDDLVNTT